MLTGTASIVAASQWGGTPIVFFKPKEGTFNSWATALGFPQPAPTNPDFATSESTAALHYKGRIALFAGDEAFRKSTREKLSQWAYVKANEGPVLSHFIHTIASAETPIFFTGSATKDGDSPLRAIAVTEAPSCLYVYFMRFFPNQSEQDNALASFQYEFPAERAYFDPPPDGFVSASMERIKRGVVIGHKLKFTGKPK